MAEDLTRPLVGFAFYEAADFGSVEPVMARLEAEGRLRAAFLKGFDHKEHAGQIPRWILPAGGRQEDARSLALETPAGRALAADPMPPRLCRGVEPGDALGVRQLAAAVSRPDLGGILFEVALAAEGLRAWLGLRRPRLVVIPEDCVYARGRLAAHLLAAAGIRSVVLHPAWFAMMADYPLVGPRLADHYLVANELVGARLLAAGVAASHVEVVGLPVLDGVTPVRRRAASRPCVLYALQGLPWEPSIVADLSRATDSLGIDLILKAHPRAVCAPIAPGRARIVRDGTATQLFPEVDLVMAQSSRVLFEAAVAGLPVVAVDYGGPPPAALLPAEIPIARDPDDLARGLGDLVAGRLQAPEPSRLTANPGHATAAVVAALERLAVSA